MKKILIINDELRKRILDFLYEDELFNVFLINFIENKIEDIGELFIEEKDDVIESILHIKFDGNSYFTSFFTKRETGHNDIAKQLEILNYKRILLAGKFKEVEKILKYLGKKVKSDSDIYNKFDMDRYIKSFVIEDVKFRIAKCIKYDLSKIGEFMIDFFEAQNEEEITDITKESLINSFLYNRLNYIRDKSK